MTDLVTNPVIGNVLGVVNTAGLIGVYATLSRRIKRLEKLIAANGLSTNVTASGAPIITNGEIDPSQIDLVARIDQLEAQQDLSVRNIHKHEMVLNQILHEFRARSAGGHQVPMQHQMVAQQHLHHGHPIPPSVLSPIEPPTVQRQQQIVSKTIKPETVDSDESSSESDEEESGSEVSASGSEDDEARQFFGGSDQE
jgi:hypothetical protein